MDLDSGLGPLPVRNFQPVQLLFLELETESPEVLPPGKMGVRIQADVTSTVLSDFHPDSAGIIKTETIRGALYIRYGLLPRLEAGVEIPVIYRYPGFMDEFIRNVEKSVKRLNPERIKLQSSPFDYRIVVRGDEIISAQSHEFGLSDIVLHAKGVMLYERPWLPMLSLRVALKLPTGNRSDAFGSGRPEIGVGLAAEKHFLESLIGYLNSNVVFSDGRFSAPGLYLQTAYMEMLGVEWRILRHLSAHFQYEYYTSPFRGSGLNLLDHGVSEFAFGISHAT